MFTPNKITIQDFNGKKILRIYKQDVGCRWYADLEGMEYTQVKIGEDIPGRCMMFLNDVVQEEGIFTPQPDEKFVPKIEPLPEIYKDDAILCKQLVEQREIIKNLVEVVHAMALKKG